MVRAAIAVFKIDRLRQLRPPSRHGTDCSRCPNALIRGSEAENSVNIGFHAFDDFGSFADRTAAGRSYDITLSAYEGRETSPIASVHDHVNIT